MTTWTQNPPAEPSPVTSLHVGDASLYIHHRNANGDIWQSVVISTGQHTKRTYTECQCYWPIEAATMLRELADRIEKETDNA